MTIDKATRANAYADRLAIPKVKPSAEITAALTRAHELRKFEIENYWRRSTYVWGLQLVAFAALALSAKDKAFSGPIVIIVATLGIVSTFAAVLTSPGFALLAEKLGKPCRSAGGSSRGTIAPNCSRQEGACQFFGQSGQ